MNSAGCYAAGVRVAFCILLAGCAAAPIERTENTKPVSTATPSAIWFKAEVYCPPGTRYEGTVCKPLVVLNCPVGTKFETDVGCVALQPKPEPTTTAPSFSNQVKPPPPGATCQCAPNDLACVMRCQQRTPKLEPPPPAVPQGKDPFAPRN